MQEKPVYNRIMLKMSGEALAGDHGYGIDPDRAEEICEKVKGIHDLGVQIAIVIGGGNIWRGAQGVARGMEQSTADHIGMIATVMNGLALQDALERLGVKTRVQTAIEMKAVAEPYIRLRAIRHMEKGRVVIFAAGTGNPYFTSDTGASLRASEMNCDLIAKGTKVNGIYTADPFKDPNAIKYDHLTYMDILTKDLKVMDATAISLARENKVPVMVFSIREKGNFAKVMSGDGEYTIVSDN